MGKIGRRMRSALDFLGSDYTIETIDFADCIYRDLGNGFDIEVSGINYPPRGYICDQVFVWDVHAGKGIMSRIVETVGYIKTLDELKTVLDLMERKYKPC